MLYKTFSAAVYGIDRNIIEVEVDVSGIKMQEDHFHTLGLPDAAVRESRDRVRPPCATTATTLRPLRSPSTWPRQIFASKARASTIPWLWAFSQRTGALTRKNCLTVFL